MAPHQCGNNILQECQFLELGGHLVAITDWGMDEKVHPNWMIIMKQSFLVGAFRI